MNAVFVILALALVFYFMQRMHGQLGGCKHGHAHGATGTRRVRPKTQLALTERDRRPERARAQVSRRSLSSP